MKDIRIVSPGTGGQVINEYGKPERPPSGWTFVPAGDAAVTRKITAQGKYWRVQVKKGRRVMSKGIWAPTIHIVKAKEAVVAMRAAPDYEKKKLSAQKSREKKQQLYEEEFEKEVIKYLNFHEKYRAVEKTMAKAITAHAIPVGSGTVARTSMIPISDRAGKAVIAWMRHQTTNYDQMKIARIKGERRAVRRQLAEKSKDLLIDYRKGNPIKHSCPLYRALKNQS